MVKRILHSLPAISVLIVVYFFAGKLGLRLAVVHPSATAVWPGTGIALAALLVFGFDIWPGIFIGSFLVNLTTAGTAFTSLGIASGNTIEAVLAAYLVVKFAHGRGAFERAEDVFKFALLSGVLATAVAATVGVASLSAGRQLIGANPRDVWFTWWLGDMVGAIVLAPCLILWSSGWRGWWRMDPPRVQGVAAAVILLLVGIVLFGGLLPAGLQNFPLAFLCVPLIVWASFHLRPLESSTLVLGLSGIAIWGTLRGIGGFGEKNPNDALLILQAFMGAIAMTNLVLSAVVSEGEQDEASRIRSETRLRLAQKAAGIGTWEWDPGQNQNSLSPELHDMFGTEETDPNRVALWEARIYPDDLPKVRREMESGSLSGAMEFEYRYQHSERGLRWFYCKGARLASGDARMFGVLLDITERKGTEEALVRARQDLENRVNDRTSELRKAERNLRALSSRLLQMQDEERRRIARELHDSSGQILAALNLNLAVLRNESDKLTPRGLHSLKESLEYVGLLSKELRTMSHLLHPPLLDELGLVSAIRWYVEGFAERSKIPVELEIDAGLGRMSRELETTIFRIVQECLTNVHRHSESPTARVSIKADAEEITILVRDRGKGIAVGSSEIPSEQVRPGVGIQGMRERVRQLGGRLEIDSADAGTTVAAILPLLAEPEIRNSGTRGGTEEAPLS